MPKIVFHWHIICNLITKDIFKMIIIHILTNCKVFIIYNSLMLHHQILSTGIRTFSFFCSFWLQDFLIIHCIFSFLPANSKLRSQLWFSNSKILLFMNLSWPTSTCCFGHCLVRMSFNIPVQYLNIFFMISSTLNRLPMPLVGKHSYRLMQAPLWLSSETVLINGQKEVKNSLM